MKQRVISGTVLAGIAVAVIAVNVYLGYVLSATAAVIACLCVYELYRCVEVPVKGIYFAYAEIFTLAVILCFIPNYSHIDFIIKLQGIFIAAFIVITAANGLFSKDGLRKTMLLSLITALLVISFSIIAYWGTQSIRTESGYHAVGLNMLLITIITPCVSDTAGLLGGRVFGRHKMAPRISPKKTWEGFASSCICTPLVLMLVGLVSDLICASVDVSCRANYLSLCITGLAGAVFATLGDLFFSVIKRKTGVKDYGTILPGHGGMLDRFDSFVFTPSLLFLIFSIFPQFSAV